MGRRCHSKDSARSSGPLALAFALLLPWSAAAREAAPTAPPVELRCKIVAARAEKGYKLWKVELKRASGELIRQNVGGAGDTVVFKNLEPAIYIVCISGEKGRNRCESIDLVPGPSQADRRFSRQIQTPGSVLNKSETHRVDTRRLAIPERARREMVRAEEAQLRGDGRAAVEHLERAVQLYPSYADALNNLGTHHHRAGNYARSADYFSRVVKLDPNFFPGWVNLGGSLLAQGKIEGALEANLKACKIRPDDPLVNTQLGIGYFYLRRYREAKGYFTKVVDVDPSSANSPQLFLAHIAMAERRPGDAEVYIRGYLELHPNSPRAPNLRRTLENLASGKMVGTQEIANRER